MDPRTLFLAACIPARILMAILPKLVSKTWLRYYGLVLLTIGIGFHSLYLSGSRLRAPEGGGYTWWHEWRPVHGTLYLIAGGLAFHGDPRAWIPLTIDIIIGIVLHVKRYGGL